MKNISPHIFNKAVIREEIDLKALNSFQVATSARYFADVNDVEQLKLLMQQSVARDHKTLILGGGSNILFSSYFNGLVTKVSIPGIELVSEDDKYVWVKAGAGVNWHAFVQFCLKQNYAGVENLSLIPGSVGAAPIQNIGAYGIEVEQVFSQLEALDRNSGKLRQFDKKDCRFAYRDSVFKNELKNQFIITSVTLKLNKTPELNLNYGAINQTLDEMNVKNPTIQDVSEAVCRIRMSKLPDPAVLGNSGSFFKNPVIHGSDFQALNKKFPKMPHYELDDGRIK
ncbi:MAG: UDP-N-acetylmuramate dehydrogenase, partial [Balneolales bacterium]